MEIHNRNPKAKIVLLGYPHLVGKYPYYVGLYPAGNEIRKLLELGTTKQLEAVSETKALFPRTDGDFVTYLPALSYFAGREPSPPLYPSNDNTWLLEARGESNTISFLTWYHPNPKGHNAYFEILRDNVGVPGPEWIPR